LSQRDSDANDVDIPPTGPRDVVFVEDHAQICTRAGPALMPASATSASAGTGSPKQPTSLPSAVIFSRHSNHVLPLLM